MALHYLASMTPILEAEARITSQNQITIPASIRKALHLTGGKNRIKFQVFPGDGTVLVVRADPPASEEEDPALKPFLDMLTKDIKEHPKRIQPFPNELLERMRSAIKGVEVDLNGPLTGED